MDGWMTGNFYGLFISISFCHISVMEADDELRKEPHV